MVKFNYENYNEDFIDNDFNQELANEFAKDMLNFFFELCNVRIRYCKRRH